MHHSKTCFKCKECKPIDEFYKHPMMADGHLGKCKTCAKADVAKNYRTNIDHYVAYEKVRFQRKERKLAMVSYAKRRDAQKKLANRAADCAIRSGKLVRQPCEKCGAVRAEAHHDDYAKPLAVRWLCRKHHLEHHGKVQRTKPRDTSVAEPKDDKTRASTRSAK